MRPNLAWPILAIGGMFAAVLVVSIWSGATLRLVPDLSVPSRTVPQSPEAARTVIEVVTKEKDTRLAEASAHAERLQNGIIFYLTVVIAGIFTAVLRKEMPSWRDLRSRKATPFLVILFLLANVAMLAQAMSISLNAIANAKFVHVYLDPQIASLAALPGDSQKPHDVFYWDQWASDYKQLYMASRDAAACAWVVVVGVVSLAALAFFSTRQLSATGAAAAYAGLLLVNIFAAWLLVAGVMYGYLGHQFDKRAIVPLGTTGLSTLATLGFLAVTTAIVIGSDRIADSSTNVPKSRESGA